MEETNIMRDDAVTHDGGAEEGEIYDFAQGFEEGIEDSPPDDWGSDAVPDEAESSKPQSEAFRLKHLGEEVEVSREEVIALAQKGRDYGRIRDRLARLEADGSDSPKAAAAMADIHDFVSRYGSSIDPATIPEEVWSAVRGGEPLLLAYKDFENRRLRQELQHIKNRDAASGNAYTAGEGGIDGLIESSWFSD